MTEFSRNLQVYEIQSNGELCLLMMRTAPDRNGTWISVPSDMARGIVPGDTVTLTVSVCRAQEKTE
jgi:hypothetical protein